MVSAQRKLHALSFKYSRAAVIKILHFNLRPAYKYGAKYALRVMPFNYIQHHIPFSAMVQGIGNIKFLRNAYSRLDIVRPVAVYF